MFIAALKQVRCYCSSARRPYYVTTPIFYVNAAPHIGHLYSAVIADAICRYERLRDPLVSVHLCTGTDEHGTKIQQAAAQHNVPVHNYCDGIANQYRQVFAAASIGHTDFIRTTEQRHKNAVAHFWEALKSRGHIYSAQYSGWYCVPDETFLTETQLRVDSVTGTRHSLESGHPAEWTEETNYMFRLSAMQDEVIAWLKHGAGRRVQPAKFDKILGEMLSEPLPDVSVSRPANRVHWGIPVPGDPQQTVYVWLDALINYLTSTGYPDEKYRELWPPKVQVIGKDILKFHGIYWPAFLLAAGLEPPQQLFVHSHWTVDGVKMSKSKQNVVDPVTAADTYSMEGLRYFLLREGVAHSDGNFSDVKAQRILNSELADTLGNLLSRVCAKSLNPQQVYPRRHPDHADDLLRNMEAAARLQDALQQLGERCARHYDDRNFYLATDTVIAALHAANNFFETARPWLLKQRPGGNGGGDSATTSPAMENIANASRLETIIAMTMDALRLCGIVLQPIVPHLSGRLLDKLNVAREQRQWRHLSEWPSQELDKDESTSRLPLNGTIDAILFRRILPKDEEQPQQQQRHKQQQPTSQAVTATADATIKSAGIAGVDKQIKAKKAKSRKAA